MKRPPACIDVVAAILWRGDRFLAVRRPPGKPMAGMWEFPGGKLEPGETPADALVREIREELGVISHRPAYWKETTHAYPNLRVRLLFFHVREFTGDPAPLEGQGMAWLTPGEALAYPFLEADTDIVRELGHTAPPAGDS